MPDENGEIVSNVYRTKSVAEIDGLISSLVAAGQLLLLRAPKLPGDLREYWRSYQAWDRRCESTLRSCFQESTVPTPEPINEFSSTANSLLDLEMNVRALTPGRFNEMESGVREKLRVLNSIRGQLDNYEGPAFNKAAPSRRPPSIFLVHGHNHVLRDEVQEHIADFTSTRVTILDNRPNQGRDLLGKLLENAAEAAFAVILMTPDDRGGVVDGDELRPRARQNVILELGLFLGLIGRGKVVALYDKTVEMPSDYLGVMYISLSDPNWPTQLKAEMKAAGIKVKPVRKPKPVAQ